MVTRPGGRLSLADAEKLLAGPSAALSPLTIAAGADDFLRERAIAAFRAGGASERSEFRRLEGDDLTAAELAEAFASISLFGDLRRIWIREGSKLERAAEEALLAWAGGPGEGVRVLLSTAREISDLKGLQTLAANATVVPCVARPEEARRWAAELVRQAGLRLPAGAVDAIASRTQSLLALSREVEKLALVADSEGKVPASALDAVSVGRGAASAGTWATAVLEGDTARARAEAAVLDFEGVAGSACLWAIAERAFAALEPQSYGYQRGRAPSGPAVRPAAARAALHAVYRADLALKRGEVPDRELRDYVTHEIERSDDA